MPALRLTISSSVVWKAVLIFAVLATTSYLWITSAPDYPLEAALSREVLLPESFEACRKPHTSEEAVRGDGSGKRWFLTFGAGRFASRIQAVQEEVRALHYFDHVRAWTADDLPASFRRRFHHFLQPDVRGFGYWIWKSLAISVLLEEMNDGDVLLYADAGCDYSGDETAMRRMDDYFELVKESDSGVLAFQLEDRPENQWTKGDLAHLLHVEKDPLVMNTDQMVGGVVFLRKSDRAVALVSLWHQISTRADLHFVSDSPSRLVEETAEFQEHRHDQSVFSLLVKVCGGSFIADESWPVDRPGVPIHAARRTS